MLSTISASPEAAAFGVVGMLPLLAYGLALDLKRDDWDWVRKIDEATSEVALQLFGSERQVRAEPLRMHSQCSPLEPKALQATYAPWYGYVYSLPSTVWMYPARSGEVEAPQSSGGRGRQLDRVNLSSTHVCYILEIAGAALFMRNIDQPNTFYPSSTPTYPNNTAS